MKNERFLRIDLNAVAVSRLVPRREFDLIEFLKNVKQNYEIVAIEIDYENHIIEFAIREVKKNG